MKNIGLKAVYAVTCLLAVWLFFVLPATKPHGLSSPRTVEVLIEPGQSAAEIADEFVRTGLVKSPKTFLWWMSRLGFDRKLKPGRYALHPGSAWRVAHELRDAEPLVLRVTILPGALSNEVASELKEEDGEALLGKALANEANFPEALRVLLSGDVSDRLVFLAPETYEIAPGYGCADRLVKSASRKWWRQHGAEIPEGTTADGLRDDGVLASIIQKEALFDSERPLMAGVFGNRLRKNMPLQSCATIVYAWRLRGVKRTALSYEDLKIESPYNTYSHNGLPPGHIGVPSASSWSAVFNPQQTDKLFFVADKDGRHVFTRTYEEHLAAQRKINGEKR